MLKSTPGFKLHVVLAPLGLSLHLVLELLACRRAEKLAGLLLVEDLVSLVTSLKTLNFNPLELQKPATR